MLAFALGFGLIMSLIWVSANWSETTVFPLLVPPSHIVSLEDRSFLIWVFFPSFSPGTVSSSPNNILATTFFNFLVFWWLKKFSNALWGLTQTCHFFAKHPLILSVAWANASETPMLWKKIQGHLEGFIFYFFVKFKMINYMGLKICKSYPSFHH